MNFIQTTCMAFLGIWNNNPIHTSLMNIKNIVSHKADIMNVCTIPSVLDYQKSTEAFPTDVKIAAVLFATGIGTVGYSLYKSQKPKNELTPTPESVNKALERPDHNDVKAILLAEELEKRRLCPPRSRISKFNLYPDTETGRRNELETRRFVVEINKKLDKKYGPFIKR